MKEQHRQHKRPAYLHVAAAMAMGGDPDYVAVRRPSDACQCHQTMATPDLEYRLTTYNNINLRFFLPACVWAVRRLCRAGEKLISHSRLLLLRGFFRVTRPLNPAVHTQLSYYITAALQDVTAVHFSHFSHFLLEYHHGSLSRVYLVAMVTIEYKMENNEVTCAGSLSSDLSASGTE